MTVFRQSIDAVEIVPGLWLGSTPTGRQARELAKRGIDAVVDLRAERDTAEVIWPARVDVRYAPMQDHGSPSAQELEDAAATVAELLAQGRTVLVHCRAGLERAPTVACAALVVLGWGLDTAYQRVTERRQHSLPTDGQLAALRELQARHARAAQS